MFFTVLAQALLWFFALLGLIEAILKLCNFFFSSRARAARDIDVFVCLKGRNESVEYLVKALRRKLEDIETEQGMPDIYLVDEGMDYETRRTCMMLCGDYRCVHMVKPDGIERAIERKKGPVV